MQGFWGARQAENQQESTAEASTQQSSTPLLNGLATAALFLFCGLGGLTSRMTSWVNAVRFDMAGENAEHQQAEQQHRQADANRQRLGRAFTLAFVLNQKHHTAGETDNDRGKCRNDKNLDQLVLLQVNIRDT